MQINKELSHLKAHFLEGKPPQKSSLLKGSSVRRNGFLPFTLGVNVGWIVSLFLWKLCVKQAEKSGLSVSEWIGQKIFATIYADESASSQPQASSSPLASTAKTSTVSSASVKAPEKSTKTVAKAKKEPAKKTSVKKTKSSSKKASTKKATKAEEKKTAKKAVKAEKAAKKTVTASKAKKKVKKSEDKT